MVKKSILYSIVALISLLVLQQGSLNAQSFTYSPNDTIYVEGTGSFFTATNYVQAISSDIEVEWIIRDRDLPLGWRLYSFCDNRTCYLAPVDSAIADTIKVGDGIKDHKFEPTCIMDSTDTTCATIVVEVRTTDRTFSHFFTYIFCKKKELVSISEYQKPQVRVRTLNNGISFFNPFVERAKYQVLDFSGRLLFSGDLSREEEKELSIDSPVIILISSGEKMVSRKFVLFGR